MMSLFLFYYRKTMMKIPWLPSKMREALASLRQPMHPIMTLMRYGGICERGLNTNPSTASGSVSLTIQATHLWRFQPTDSCQVSLDLSFIIYKLAVVKLSIATGHDMQIYNCLGPWLHGGELARLPGWLGSWDSFDLILHEVSKPAYWAGWRARQNKHAKILLHFVSNWRALCIVMPCCFTLFALYACSAPRNQPGCWAGPLVLLLHESEPAQFAWSELAR